MSLFFGGEVEEENGKLVILIHNWKFEEEEGIRKKHLLYKFKHLKDNGVGGMENGIPKSRH